MRPHTPVVRQGAGLGLAAGIPAIGRLRDGRRVRSLLFFLLLLRECFMPLLNDTLGRLDVLR